MQDARPLGHLISIEGKFAHVVGIDYGPNVTLEAQNSECIVLKIGGHSYWSGRNLQSYAEAERVIFRIVKKLGKGHYSVEPLISYPTRRKK